MYMEYPLFEGKSFIEHLGELRTLQKDVLEAKTNKLGEAETNTRVSGYISKIGKIHRYILEMQAEDRDTALSALTDIRI
jgi:hypothetical protein